MNRTNWSQKALMERLNALEAQLEAAETDGRRNWIRGAQAEYDEIETELARRAAVRNTYWSKTDWRGLDLEAAALSGQEEVISDDDVAFGSSSTIVLHPEEED